MKKICQRVTISSLILFQDTIYDISRGKFELALSLKLTEMGSFMYIFALQLLMGFVGGKPARKIVVINFCEVPFLQLFN